jgi:cytochrome c
VSPARWGAVAVATALVAGVAGSASAGTTAPAGDPVAGERVYARCLACHALDRDRTGPHHCGLLGRRAGSVPGFGYSPAMKASGLTWTTATLDRFLADPTGVVPGTAMTWVGVTDPTERRDLIAWLVVATSDPARCPAP